MHEESELLQAIIARIKKLEAAVFGDKRRNRPMRPSVKNSFAGPTGGVRLLLDEGFFKQKRSVDEVHQNLEKKSYLYNKDVVRNSLNRMSSTDGPLVAIKRNGGKLYAVRK